MFGRTAVLDPSFSVLSFLCLSIALTHLVTPFSCYCISPFRFQFVRSGVVQTSTVGRIPLLSADPTPPPSPVPFPLFTHSPPLSAQIPSTRFCRWWNLLIIPRSTSTPSGTAMKPTPSTASSRFVLRSIPLFLIESFACPAPFEVEARIDRR